MTVSSPQNSKPRIRSRPKVGAGPKANYDTNVKLPSVGEWRVVNATLNRDAMIIEGEKKDESTLLESEAFTLRSRTTFYFLMFFETISPCGLRLSLRTPFGAVAERAVFGSGELALCFRYDSKRGGKFHLTLAGYQPHGFAKVKAHIVRLEVRAVPRGNEIHPGGRLVETYLPHWTKWQRAVHSLCVRSRSINAAIAAWELHLRRDEILSLPQYMAICPTGQCNASCGFCSVTTNRTGIIKKQLPFEALDRFLSPVFGSLRLFGLEGNGEPTLYDRFDELLFRVTSRGAAVYLISNGERLTSDQIALLIASPTDAINFSLNAATAETHQRVMKLKGWDSVVRNISSLVRWRGDVGAPLVSVSLVVTRDNAHEVQQFLHFAEWQLKVDRILIRPLSEIANDSGVVEDLRELVPYESQITDMLDAVAEYFEFVPRRADIVIDPAAFNAFRQEPRGASISPPGFENQLLAPRRTEWFVESHRIQARWQLNRLEISGNATRNSIVARSPLVPVVAGRLMTFRCRARTCQGTIEVAIVDTSGELLGCAISGDETKDRLEFLSIIFTAPETGTVTIELRSTKEVIGSVIEFGQMYSRPVLAIKDVKLPHGSRWQVDMPGTSAYWQGNELVLNAQAQPFLYLYRSYTVPTTLNEFIELAVQVTIENGALGIGVLSENGNEWLLCSRFESEHHATTIAFNTGNHVGFQVVLFALNAEPLRARIDWGNRLDVPPVHKKRTIDPKQLLLPVPTNWLVDSPGADVRWNGDQVRIIWSGPQRLYLLRSPRFPCPHLSSAMPKLSLHISVKSGCLCIGFLGGNTETFASLSYFGEGAHNATIEIDTRGQHSLMVVLYSNSPKPLDATIDWGKSVSLELQEEAQREWRGGSFDPRKVDSESTAQALIGLNDRQKNLDDFVDDQSNTPPLSELFVPPSISTRVTKTYMQAGVAGVIRKAAHSFLKKTIPTRVAQIYIDAGVVGLIGKALGYLTQRALPHSLTRGLGFNSLLKLCFPKAAIYCQKPWTDLNNFTVDGRMDVCCITTGPSQERYALGNIFKQDFQEIWNGERMKEFRRTVNTEDKLPPCARCPMANNYKPPF